MRRRIFFGIQVVLLNTVLSATSLAQLFDSFGSTVNVIESFPQPALTKIGTQSWASGGTGVCEPGIHSSAFTNPACMKYESSTLYAEGGQRSSAEFTLGQNYDGQSIAPSYLAFGSSFKGFNYQLGYFNQYNYRVAAEIPITTADHPEGTGEYFTYERTIRTHSYFAALGYAPIQDLSFGLTVGFTLLKTNERYGDVSADAHGWQTLVVAGLLLEPLTSLHIGANFRSLSRASLDVQYSDEALRPKPPRFNPAPTFIAELPWTAEAGISWDASGWKLLASIEFQKWSSILLSSRYYAPYKDQLDFHVGTAISISPSISARFGLFTQNVVEENVSDLDLSQVFWTVGATWFVTEGLSLSIAGMDSHLFSRSSFVLTSGVPSTSFRQSYISIAVNYAL